MASPQQPAPPSNPFDGFDNYSAVAQQPPPPAQPHQQPAVAAVAPNQWAAQQQQPAAGSAFPFAQPPPPQQQHNPAAAHPFGSPVPPAALPLTAPVAGVAQQQPAFAYSQQPASPHQQQQQLATLPPNAIVPSPWALQLPPAPVVAPPAAGGQTYDPLDIFGAPQKSQQPAPQQTILAQQPQQTSSNQLKLQEEVQQFNLETHNQSLLPDESEDEGLALIDVELDDDDSGANSADNLENRKKDGEFLDSSAFKETKTPRSGSIGGGRGGRNSRSSGGQHWDRNPDIAPPPPTTPGRNHAEYLAEHSAPAMSSPLPKPELVHHSGYVLSRISFRTVLMRKWKQTFWIQYGPTQLLFFRTFSDYEDWLNNPYHTQKAREFLVKLRVDFVSDLKKSSVMGYQVTQVRRKPYGKNVMLHFKLERWMDYGPTIAAAFAAREEEMMNSPSHQRNSDADDGMNTSNDVSALRKIILGCMRNARDAALIAASRERERPTDMAESVGYRGRYDVEHQRDIRIPSGDRNMGYHQAFSAERGERRPMPPRDDDSAAVSTESSQDEVEQADTSAPPVVDLLG